MMPLLGALEFAFVMNPLDFYFKTKISAIPDTLTALGFAYEAYSYYAHGEYDGRGMKLALCSSLVSAATSGIEGTLNNTTGESKFPFFWAMIKPVSAGSWIYATRKSPRKKKPFPKPKQIYEKVSSIFSKDKSDTEFTPFYEK